MQKKLAVMMSTNQWLLFLYIKKKSNCRIHNYKKSYTRTILHTQTLMLRKVFFLESLFQTKLWVMQKKLAVMMSTNQQLSLFIHKEEKKQIIVEYIITKRATPAPPKVFLTDRLWCLEKYFFLKVLFKQNHEECRRSLLLWCQPTNGCTFYTKRRKVIVEYITTKRATPAPFYTHRLWCL